MDEVFIPLIAIVTLFIGLPWLVFHYITRWKTAATLTGSDEKLLDELHDAARRLDDRLQITVPVEMRTENPGGVATYTNFRRFGVETDTVIPVPPAQRRNRLRRSRA